MICLTWERLEAIIKMVGALLQTDTRLCVNVNIAELKTIILMKDSELYFYDRQVAE